MTTEDYTRITAADLNEIQTSEDLERAHQSIANTDDMMVYVPDALISVSVVLGMFDPQTADDVKASVALVKRFAPPGQTLLYEGYVQVECGSAEQYAWECITHFMAEGLEDAALEFNMNRYEALFEEAFPEFEEGVSA